MEVAFARLLVNYRMGVLHSWRFVPVSLFLRFFGIGWNASRCRSLPTVPLTLSLSLLCSILTLTVQTIVSVLGPDFHLVGDGSLDIRIYSLIILILLLVLVLIGVSWVVKGPFGDWRRF